MAKTFIGVREVDEEVFRKFRAKTVEEKMKLGYALSLAMKLWIEKEKKKEENKENELKGVKQLLKVKPFNFGPGTEKLSSEIDKILYGKEE